VHPSSLPELVETCIRHDPHLAALIGFGESGENGIVTRDELELALEERGG